MVEDGTLEPLLIVSRDLDADIARLQGAGFRLDMISPADAPRVAEMGGHGVTFRLDALATVAESTPTVTNTNTNENVFVSANDDEVDVGRAGMHYRDLIPDRHGGAVIASHISIPGAGPVADYVHHHDIDFQVIYVIRGRVKVIYEDQGEAFWMAAGDCVLQPPHIRHRVLESADDCEVIEVASPAEHPTFVEHEINLPTRALDPNRDFGGQRFQFSQGSAVSWEPAGVGWERSRSGIGDASAGAGEVHVLRGRELSPGPMEVSGEHRGTLCLFVVLAGACTIDTEPDHPGVALDTGDSVAITSGTAWSLRDASADCRVLHVSMP